MRTWQQLKVVLTDRDNILHMHLNSNTIESVDEIQSLIGLDKLTFEHLGWLGWELVTVCNNSFYYKRLYNKS